MANSSLIARPPVRFLEPWDSPSLVAVTKTLANGLRVVLTENHTVPLVWLNWVCLGGFECDPESLPGIAALTPGLLREGTARRSAAEISDEIDDLGADLVAGADWDAAFLNLELLSSDLAAGASLLIDMACRPRFTEAAVAGMRQRQLAELERRRRNARALADEAFARAIYGDTTYGRPSLGTPVTLAKIGTEDVAAFHDVHYSPANSCMVVAGSFDSDEAADLLSAFELPRVAPAEPASPPSSARDAAAARITLVDVRQAAQTELRVGHDSVARDSEDLPGLEVLNAILGRGPSSRLASSLRQRQGLTYHVGSRVVARRRGGQFVVETSVPTHAAAAALATIGGEIERLQHELVPAADVEQAKRSLMGAELQRFQSIFGTGVTIGPVALDGDPVRHFELRRQSIAAIDSETLRELARRRLHPERLIAVAVGPAGILKSQFQDRAHQRQAVPLESLS